MLCGALDMIELIRCFVQGEMSIVFGRYLVTKHPIQTKFDEDDVPREDVDRRSQMDGGKGKGKGDERSDKQGCQRYCTCGSSLTSA